MPRFFKTKSKCTIRIFAAASFLNDLGSDMIRPLWPLFVVQVLGANMTILGLIDGLGEALVSISQAVSGWLSDRWKKRKVFIWVGYLCGAISRVGYAFTTSWPWLIPFRGLDRIGKIRGAPRDAIIADISTKRNRGKNFGFLRAFDHLGAVVGITISLLLFQVLGYRQIFLLAVLPSLISAGLILKFVHERKKTKAGSSKGVNFRKLSLNLKLFFLVSAFFSLGAFSYSFLLLFAKNAGFSAATVPIFYLIFTLVASLSSLPFGKLSDRIGRKLVLIIALVLWAITDSIAIFSSGNFAIFIMFILYGFHLGALQPSQKAFVSELAPVKFRASVLGGYQMVVGLCALPASLAAGLFWDWFGFLAPFKVSLVLTVLSIILLTFVGTKKATQ